MYVMKMGTGGIQVGRRGRALVFISDIIALDCPHAHTYPPTDPGLVSSHITRTSETWTPSFWAKRVFCAMYNKFTWLSLLFSSFFVVKLNYRFPTVSINLLLASN